MAGCFLLRLQLLPISGVAMGVRGGGKFLPLFAKKVLEISLKSMGK